ncbi:hypothetical protein PMAYCL1PPCAC_26471, partial [Pristionchus mayeri]
RIDVLTRRLDEVEGELSLQISKNALSQRLREGPMDEEYEEMQVKEEPMDDEFEQMERANGILNSNVKLEAKDDFDGASVDHENKDKNGDRFSTPIFAPFIRMMTHSNYDVAEEATKAVGEIALESKQLRDAII